MAPLLVLVTASDRAAANAPPVIDDQGFAIDEHRLAGALVGMLEASDPDEDALTWRIAAGNTGGAFALDAASGALSVNDASAVDFETTPSFALTVQVEDAALLSDAATVTVDLNDLVPVQFTDVAASRGLQSFTPALGMGTGAAVADFDDDGNLDIFVPTAAGVPHRLYRNLGGGHFADVADAVGLDVLAPGRAALWLDYDGDGLLDLVVASDCFAVSAPCSDPLLALYRQVSPGVFLDTTTSAQIGITAAPVGNPHIGGLSAGDLDGDGDLDLVVSVWGNSDPNAIPPSAATALRVLRNDGGVAFTETSQQSGILPSFENGWQTVLHDFDRDGFLDVFQAIDFEANRLWRNQGDGTFVDAAPSAQVDTAFNEMGVSLGDVDSDGDVDLFVTNWFSQGKHNVLFRNDSAGGSLLYTEISGEAGVRDAGWGWGTTLFDADNDGRLDLAATNGFSAPPWDQDASRFYANSGGDPPVFADESEDVRLDDTDWGCALLAFDADRDGDLDVLQSTNAGGLRLLENEPVGATGNYLVVQPRMSGPNRRAIGAVVRVTAGSLSTLRVVTAGTSFLGQEPAEAFFGLGAETMAQVVVEWPDGSQTAVADVAANQRLLVEQGVATPVPITGWVVALAALLLGLGARASQAQREGDEKPCRHAR